MPLTKKKNLLPWKTIIPFYLRTSRRTHSTTNFYVFGYHSEDSLYAQKTGCVNGEDLSYVLGAPLLGTPNALFGNYSRQEAQLSEMVINYWANFFRSG